MSDLKPKQHLNWWNPPNTPSDPSDGYRLRVISQRNSSSCTRYGGYRTQWTGPHNITVEIFHFARSKPGVACTRDMVTDVTVVPLGFGFEPGTEYTVTVNDNSRSFVAGPWTNSSTSTSSGGPVSPPMTATGSTMTNGPPGDRGACGRYGRCAVTTATRPSSPRNWPAA